MYLVPSLANQTVLGEVAKGGDVGALPFVLTFVSSAVPALLAALFASWRMRSERYVLAV
jgi:sodium transport system permease protein